LIKVTIFDIIDEISSNIEYYGLDNEDMCLEDAQQLMKVAQKNLHKSWCGDCGVRVFECGEYYSLRDSVWKSVARKSEMLCVGCIEERLGRLLVNRDFRPCPLTDEIPLNPRNYSARLISRVLDKSAPATVA
jgi:hypothetical protein